MVLDNTHRLPSPPWKEFAYENKMAPTVLWILTRKHLEQFGTGSVYSDPFVPSQIFIEESE